MSLNKTRSAVAIAGLVTAATLGFGLPLAGAQPPPGVPAQGDPVPPNAPPKPAEVWNGQPIVWTTGWGGRWGVWINGQFITLSSNINTGGG